VQLYLVHHGEALGPEVDPLRPLSQNGRQRCEALAAIAARRGVLPSVVWHSGKLRAKQTAEVFWRACNPLASFAATRDLQPEDQPGFMRDRLRYETNDIMLVGHFPHLPRLYEALTTGAGEDTRRGTFPLHGLVALETRDDGENWMERFRLEP